MTKKLLDGFNESDEIFNQCPFYWLSESQVVFIDEMNRLIDFCLILGLLLAILPNNFNLDAFSYLQKLRKKVGVFKS